MATKRVTAAAFLRELEVQGSNYVRDVLIASGVDAPELKERTKLPASTCRAFLNGNRPNPVASQFKLFIRVARQQLGVRL
jgi:hypothetical protein